MPMDAYGQGVVRAFCKNRCLACAQKPTYFAEVDSRFSHCISDRPLPKAGLSLDFYLYPEPLYSSTLHRAIGK